MNGYKFNSIKYKEVWKIKLFQIKSQNCTYLKLVLKTFKNKRISGKIKHINYQMYIKNSYMI